MAHPPPGPPLRGPDAVGDRVPRCRRGRSLGPDRIHLLFLLDGWNPYLCESNRRRALPCGHVLLRIPRDWALRRPRDFRKTPRVLAQILPQEFHFGYVARKLFSSLRERTPSPTNGRRPNRIRARPRLVWHRVRLGATPCPAVGHHAPRLDVPRLRPTKRSRSRAMLELRTRSR